MIYNRLRLGMGLPPPPSAIRPLGRMLPLALAGLLGCGFVTDEGPPNERLVESGVEYQVTVFATGLDHPWGIAFLPNGEGALVTERPGRLRWIGEQGVAAEPVAGVPDVRAGGQGGLLDVALHPDFEENRWVYLTYSKPGQRGATTAVARGRFEEGRLNDVEDVFVADAWTSGSRHFGSRVVFDREGYLWVTVGDRGEGEPAQELGNHIGTTIRLHDDGSVPSDNPFVGREDARDEIFSYGHRNAQGMAVHPESGEIWQNEHGPRGGDAVNRIVAGANYGWPDYNFGSHYNLRGIPDPEPGLGIELPLLYWTPSIAPSGMAIYGGDAFPAWRGDIFVGALAGRHLRRVRFEGTTPVEQEVLLEDHGHRIRAVVEGPDGLLYLLVDAPDAPVLQLVPEGGSE